MGAPARTRDLIESTERISGLIDAGNHEALQAMMAKDTAAALTREVVLDTWAQAVADTGHLTGCRDTRIELPGGTPLTWLRLDPGTMVVAVLRVAAQLFRCGSIAHTDKLTPRAGSAGRRHRWP